MWRWLLGAVVVVVALLCASLSNRGPDWQETMRWADACRASWQVERGVPEMPHEPLPGSAVDTYAAAARAAAGLDAKALQRLLDAPMPLQPTAADQAALAAQAPVVALVLQAARQRGSGDGATAAARLEVLDLLRAIEALQVHEKMLAGTDPEAAFAVVLAGLQVGSDLVHSPYVIESAIGQVVVLRFVGRCADERLRVISPAHLARLGAVLAAVDRSFRHRPDPAAHQCIDLVESLRSPTALDGFLFGPWVHLRAWRHGFSILELARDQAAELVALVAAQEHAREHARSAPSTAWPAERARLGELDTQFTALDSIGWGPGRLVEMAREQRAALVELRLLRLAVAFHARQELPPLVDPFGASDLVARLDGDRATFVRTAAVGEPASERTAERAPR